MRQRPRESEQNLAGTFRCAVVVEGGVGVDKRGGDGRAQRRSGHKASRVSTMDVNEKEGLTPVGGRSPPRVHQDTSLSLQLMSNALAIDDGHPLALELKSLRATVAKYQVSVVVSFAP